MRFLYNIPMLAKFKTQQEKFWSGSFGDEYTRRNSADGLLAANIALFGRILSRTTQVNSAIEFGANAGGNLRAIRQLLPKAELSGIEINASAVRALKRWGGARVYAQSLLEFKPDHQRDLSLIKGVLIHLEPKKLPQAYDALYASTRRYLCLAEYYNPVPVEIPYRGHRNRLFKRDFAGELLDRFDDLRLTDYGFVYRRDNNFKQDDLNWFLLEKTGR